MSFSETVLHLHHSVYACIILDFFFPEEPSFVFQRRQDKNHQLQLFFALRLLEIAGDVKKRMAEDGAKIERLNCILRPEEDVVLLHCEEGKSAECGTSKLRHELAPALLRVRPCYPIR